MSADHSIRIEYYARIREAMGCAVEDIALPTAIATAGMLVDWLRERNAEGRAAFDTRVHVAVDDMMAQATTSLDGARTIALFPPMTGG